MTQKWCETDSKALDRKEYYQERRLKDLQLDLPWEVRLFCPPVGSLALRRHTCLCVRILTQHLLVFTTWRSFDVNG